MPTMRVTYAYIGSRTRRDDVDFYVSHWYTPQQLHQYVVRVLQRAALRGVRLLEFTVFDGEREVWRGMV